MSAELMVGAKGLFPVAIVSIALVLVSLVALILVSGWLLLQLAIVLTMGFWLPLCFLLFEFSIVFKKVIDVFGHGV
jgi:hypothetical protein